MAPQSWIAASALAAALAATAQAQPTGPAGVAPALAGHCLSQRPGRLGLSDDQIARILDIDQSVPPGDARRDAILRVLTHTQQILYWNTAGLALC